MLGRYGLPGGGARVSWFLHVPLLGCPRLAPPVTPERMFYDPERRTGMTPEQLEQLRAAVAVALTALLAVQAVVDDAAKKAAE